MPKLTKNVIDQHNAADKDYYIWDTEVKGFGCRIWPSGKKTYMFFYRSPEIQKKIGLKIRLEVLPVRPTSANIPFNSGYNQCRSQS